MEKEMEHAKIEHLEARYLHLDDRVGRMSEDVSSVKATLGSVVDALNRLSVDLKPQPVSVATWLGIGLVILGMVGSSIWGMQTYVGMQIAPLGDRVFSLEEITHERTQIIIDQAYRNGLNDGVHDSMKRRLDDIDKFGSRKWLPSGTPPAE